MVESGHEWQYNLAQKDVMFMPSS